MHSGALIMPRSEFNNNRGRPKKTGEELMVSKGVHLPPYMWQALEQKAKTETEAAMDSDRPEKIKRADIIRRAVASFFKAEPSTTQRVPMRGVIFGGEAQEVQTAPDHTFLEVPFEVGEGCYALLVVGSSMKSEDGISIPSGHYAIFCPQSSVTPGALVHVEWPSEDGQHMVTFKKYIPKPDGGAIFRPLNKKDGHKPITRNVGEYDIRGAFVRSWDGKATPEPLQ